MTWQEASSTELASTTSHNSYSFFRNTTIKSKNISQST